MPRIGNAAAGRPFVFVPHADLAILDPVTAPANIGRTHGLMVFDTLYGLDANLEPQPQMVEGASVENDGRVWRMRLRPSLRFHTGEPVLARDVRASLLRWARGDVFGNALLGALDALEVIDDRTFVFRLKKPFPQLPAALAKVSSPCPFIAPADLIGEERSVPMKQIVGSGPFRFLASETVPGARYVYERNPDYVPRQGGGSGFTAGPKRVTVERVEWRVIPDAGTAASALQAGEVDWWDQVLPDLVPLLRRRNGIRIEASDRMGLNGYLRLNHLQPPFDDPRIRRALLPAIDQIDQMTAVMGATDGGLARTGVGVFSADSPMANDEGLAVLTDPRDLKLAAARLREAGYPGAPVTLIYPTDFPAIEAMAQVSGAMLRAIGMRVDMQAMDFGTLLARRNNRGSPAQGGWNAFALANSGPDMFSPAAHTQLRANGRDGPPGWPDDPRIEELRQAWFDASSLAEQQHICRRMQAANWETVALLPLGQFFPQTAYRTSIRRGNRDITAFWDLDA